MCVYVCGCVCADRINRLKVSESANKMMKFVIWLGRVWRLGSGNKRSVVNRRTKCQDEFCDRMSFVVFVCQL